MGSSAYVEQRLFEETLVAGEDSSFLYGREMGVIVLMALIILKLFGHSTELGALFL